MSQVDVQIFGYLGSGINHLRWLLLLSNSYSINNTKDLKSKVQYIVDEVYNNRTFETWISIEGGFRKKLLNNHDINLLHNDLDDYSSYLNTKSIFLDRQPIECLKHYFKFNSNLNGIIKHHFLSSVDINSKKIKKQLPNGLVLSADFLTKEILEDSIISTIEQYLNITIPIKAAKLIHKLWFIKNKQAEEDFLILIKELYERDN
jgi:hypothetical protein